VRARLTTAGPPIRGRARRRQGRRTSWGRDGNLVGQLLDRPHHPTQGRPALLNRGRRWRTRSWPAQGHRFGDSMNAGRADPAGFTDALADADKVRCRGGVPVDQWWRKRFRLRRQPEIVPGRTHSGRQMRARLSGRHPGIVFAASGRRTRPSSGRTAGGVVRVSRVRSWTRWRSPRRSSP